MVFFVKYLHSTGHNQKRFGKVDKLYGGEKDFKDETALVKLKIFSKKKKKLSSGFLVMKIRKNSIYVSNKHKRVFYKQISNTCCL